MGRHDGKHSSDKNGKHSKRDKNKRRGSSTSSSFDDGPTTSAFDKKLELHRSKTKEQHKLEKKLAKEKETPEQKRQRRLVKKMLKEEKRNNANKTSLPECIPYTDANNPFNDNNLTEVFVWNKKLETEGKANLTKKQVEKISREKIFRNVAEMEELKRNRDIRQAAKDDMEMMSREQERSQYSDWRRTEDTFHLKQAKLRTKIRIQEGRAKPIDLLARYIVYGTENDVEFKGADSEEFELKDPLSYLKECSADDLEDLLADIKVYRVIDGRKNNTFWDDITMIVSSDVKKIAQQKRQDESGNLHTIVETDVLNVFKSKSYNDLEILNNQIRSRIANAGRGTDVGYWESTLEALNPFMGKQRLKELHSKKLALRLRRIREEQSRETAKHEEDSGFEAHPKLSEDQKVSNPSTSSIQMNWQDDDERLEQEMKSVDDVVTKNENGKLERKMERSNVLLPFTIAELEQWDEEVREKKWQLLNAEQLNCLSLNLFEHGCYSPTYGQESHAMPGIEILDEEEDKKRIESMRKRKDNADDNSSEEHSRMLAIAQQGMSTDETAFADEATLEQQTFLWSDKYRPRKPRYFNRVHTGFDWNKYNQTHYDVDNPPPKIVQGYRFNIFYPDLLDVSNTPSFKLIECEDPDFATLRFKCGPPYEDIAFKIVNREWEINHKHGYKCQFQNGVFQLWFFFKRYRYRR